jgi:DNA mismatch endonuclease (patch repair protein)
MKRRTKAQISRVMAAVKSTGTSPEVCLLKLLRRLGYPLRPHPDDVDGSPDFVFLSERVAVFLDGDFWHGRQWRLRGLSSLDQQFSRCRNRSYWIKKIGCNVKRDARVNRRLRSRGWSVVRIWESDLRRNPHGCLRRVERAIERRK